MCFSDNLKKCRIEKGLSQKELAEKIGVAPSTYSLYERGAREPDVAKIKTIAKVLGVSGDYLLFGEDDPFNTVAFALYKQLDFEDKAEIRGEMKQMLKSNKYNNKKSSISNELVEEFKQYKEKKIPINLK